MKEKNISLDEEILVSKKAWKTGGSKMFIEVGKRVKVRDILQGVITVSGNDASIATVEVEEHEEGGDHDEHGMAIHVTGVSSGSTSFQLQLMHDGHSDYTSTNNVPVTVN